MTTYPAPYQPIRLVPVLIGVCVLLAWCLSARASDRWTDVRSASQTVIDVYPDIRVRDQLPPTLFGFNLQHHNFEQDIWDSGAHRADPTVIEHLRVFPGALYRYPGGLVANRFWWEEAVGPVEARGKQGVVQSAAPYTVLFGVEEFLDLTESVNGWPLYVLNLVGWDRSRLFEELPVETISASNARLATFIRERVGADAGTLYYQLGNELDRATYEWPHDKYVARSRDTIEAVRRVDKDTRFIAFLREFDWQYKAGSRKGSSSRFPVFISDVLRGLPDVDDFSMHFYYDDPGMEDNKTKRLPWRLNQFELAIDAARKLRDGREVRVWITEHARGVNLPAGKPMHRAPYTSNLAAAVSTGDFLVALALMPEVKGAALHGLNAGPWQVFDASIHHNDLRPRPVYDAMRVLHSLGLPVVVGTRVRSTNHGGYGGGYDVRAVAFADEAGQQLGLWAINRARHELDVQLNVRSWKGRDVAIAHTFVAGADARDPDDPRTVPELALEPRNACRTFSDSGSVILTLPPSSVSSFRLDRAPDSARRECTAAGN